MALLKEKKEEIIKTFAVKDGDTGSAEVQIALLTEEIRELTAHFKEHKHDFHSKRGMLQKIGKRNSLLKWLKKEDVKRYLTLIKALGLRK